MNACASPREREPPALARRADHAAGGAREPAQPVGLAAARACRQLGREPRRQRQLDPEGERRRKPGRAVAAADRRSSRLRAVEDRQVAAEQVVGGGVRLLGVAADAGPRRRPRAAAPSAGAVVAQVRVRVDRVGRGHRAAGRRAPRGASGRGGRTAPAGRRSASAACATPFAIALDPPPRCAVQVQDPIGLAVADAAQHDRLGLELARHGHGRMPAAPADVSGAVRHRVADRGRGHGRAPASPTPRAITARVISASREPGSIG